MHGSPLPQALKELAGDFKFVRKALARRCVFLGGWITRETDSAVEMSTWHESIHEKKREI